MSPRAGLLFVLVAAASAPISHAGLADGSLLTMNRTLMEAARALVARSDPRVMPAYAKLLQQADELLVNLTASGPFSVMNKTSTAPSGNKHDYISLSEYYWPCSCTSSGPLDPPHCPNASALAGEPGDGKPPPPEPCDNATGLPYVRHDGWLDPRINDFDFEDLTDMWQYSTTLSLAYFFSMNETFGAAAARVLKTWFVDAATKMEPNMQYAQVRSAAAALERDVRCVGASRYGVEARKKACEQTSAHRIISFLGWGSTA